MSVVDDRTDRVGALIDAARRGRSQATSAASASGCATSAAPTATALAAAVADAQEQARALAGAAHLRLGRILAIAPSGGVNPIPRPMVLGRMAAMPAPVPTDVQPSDLSVARQRQPDLRDRAVAARNRVCPPQGR